MKDDEHAAFERPRGRSRPRTKIRPRYEDAPQGMVVGVDRGRYTVALDTRIVTAVKARILGRHAVVAGDHVRVMGDVSGQDGTLARIVEVAERTTQLRRTADDDDPHERIIIANADRMVIVASLADPPPRLGLIDRCLAAALAARIDALVVLTKTDLAAPDDMLSHLEPLHVPVLTMQHGRTPDDVHAAVAGRLSVLVGHSGVGKSTLMNGLVPDSQRTTGAVNPTSGRGRHTTTAIQGRMLPGGGWIFDTPGVRSFGLAHVSAEQIVDSFEDLSPLTPHCPRGCTHLASEPECALDTAVRAGTIGPERVAGLRRLLAGKYERP